MIFIITGDLNMPRTGRKKSESGIYHIVLRGINRQTIFEEDEDSIHQNPVKAGMVKDVGSYKWSSYSEYIEKNKMIDTDFALSLFSNDREKAIESFKALYLNRKKPACIFSR